MIAMPHVERTAHDGDAQFTANGPKSIPPFGISELTRTFAVLFLVYDVTKFLDDVSLHSSLRVSQSLIVFPTIR